MNLMELLSDLWRTQHPLMFGGAAFFILFLVFAAVSLFDSTQILGINRWIKPMKFAVSISIFLWTIAIYLYFLHGYETASRVVTWGVIVLMVGEIALIMMQSLRGTTSQFQSCNSV